MKVHFRLFCDKKHKHFWDCLIFSSRKEMYDWNKNDGQVRFSDGLGYHAICRHGFREKFIKGKWRRSGSIGIITFYIGRIGSGIVAHEMNHAALFWYRFKGLPLGQLKRVLYMEKLAEADESFNRQFWNNWYRLEKAGKLKKVAKGK